MQINSIAAQYLPDWIFDDQLENNDIKVNVNNEGFLFNQLDWTDNFDECIETEHNEDDKGMVGQYSAFLPGPFDGYMWHELNSAEPDQNKGYMDFNSEYAKFSRDMDQKNQQIEDENDEADTASKMLNYLISVEPVYSPDPDYFDHYQKDISSIMRAILIDWMMEVCNEFTLKRETFYYSVNYVDRFLSVHKNVKKEELQLVGVSSMFIAAKMEEVYSPRVADFAKSTDNGYDPAQIVKMEKIILKELGWKTTPPTYAMWANWYMNQWDIYITTNEYALSNPIIQSNQDITFKTSNESAYARFREIMQILDLIILDHTWLQYKPRGLVASVMFLIVGIHVGEFDLEMIWNEFVYTSNKFLDHDSIYIMLFMDFLYLSFGFQLHDLAPTVQYVSSFMSIPFNYDLPLYAQQKNALEGHFEEFLSYQTHHPLALEFIKQRIMSGNSY